MTFTSRQSVLVGEMIRT